MQQATSLTGRSAVIVGGGSGIGLATAERFAGSGARVTITGRSAERLKAAAASAAARGLTLEVSAFDAANDEQAKAFFDHVEAFDHLVLCANAGGVIGPFPSLDPTALRAYFDNKLWSYITTLRLAPASMRHGGSITLINGAASRLAAPGMAALALVNGGLDSVVRPLAIELAPTRVNAIAPGVVDTPYWARLSEEQRAAMYSAAAQAVPVRRVGTPDEIAHAALFLATNGFVTGVVLDVDGGRRLTPAMPR